MEHLAQADAEFARGRFRAALEHLTKLQPRQSSRYYLPHNLALSEALLQTGETERARRLAVASMRADGRTLVTDARALCIQARAACAAGQVKRSVRLFQRARAAADRARDGSLAAMILLDTLASIGDWLSTADCREILARCERTAMHSGEPHAAVRYHLIVAGLRTRHGLPGQAASHLRLAEILLHASPNLWLEGQLHLTHATVHTALRELSAGARQARKALACARRSGHAGTVGGANAVLAHIHLMTGRFRQAASRCRRGLRAATGLFGARARLLELVAAIEFAQGHWSKCNTQLAYLQQMLPVDAGLHASRHDVVLQVLRARLGLQRRQWPAALSACESGIAVADDRRDRPHGTVLRVLGVDALIEMERLHDAAEWIERASQQSESMPLAIRVQVERARAALLIRTTGADAARRRFGVALRILAAEGEAEARVDAAASYLRTVDPVDECLRRQVRQNPADLSPIIEDAASGAGTARLAAGASARSAQPLPLAHAAPLFDLTEKPELFARELFALLRESGCAAAIAILESRDDRVSGVLAHAGCTAEEAIRAGKSGNGAVVLAAGGARGRDLSVVVTPHEDAHSRADVRDIRATVLGARTLAPDGVRERPSSTGWLPALPAARDDGVFASAGMTRLLARARRIAAGDEPVLIVGETGTGKEVFARLIHKLSPRAHKDFTAFNCSAMPAGMAESVLFGHRSGAYTGATRDFGGVIRGAGGGTLLLDEVADLDPSVQPKLLRFLDRGDIHPLGEQRPLHVDVRIIAATNGAIDDHLRDGKLREDLYFRLNVMRLEIPPLRERREEIPVLVHHFLKRFGAARGIPALTVTDHVLDELQRHDWPGNVRQLQNHIRRLAALATDDVVASSGLTAGEFADLETSEDAAADTPADPGEPTADQLQVRVDQPLSDAVAQVERALIGRALFDAGGNASAAARRLGVSRRGLQLKRKRLGIGEMGVD